ncbi:hypothetical protein DVR12_20035 [Chitinophaga silvatica]|uniref:Uncharacterized protein n=2 Tax=Chitinophaga silvatica TaxID=2282649 RepID=A0A3E1Y643_9BACT|nr:hypothetical protein DVR12_20035 [Chitinophaga silvatica]
MLGACKKNSDQNLPTSLPSGIGTYEVSLIDNITGKEYARIKGVTDSSRNWIISTNNGIELNISPAYPYALNKLIQGNIEYIPDFRLPSNPVYVETPSVNGLQAGFHVNEKINVKTYLAYNMSNESYGQVVLKDPAMYSVEGNNIDIFPFLSIKQDNYIKVTINNIRSYNWRSSNYSNRLMRDSLIEGSFEMLLSPKPQPLNKNFSLSGLSITRVFISGTFKNAHVRVLPLPND